ncbi:SpoIIE family protein phosphatase [Nonomuraea aridisoli]|uniref:SpoIIE family protein phosphatase n=1 Tax=Nonomuraea aridisoli TaxID=2070368 RepID=UPI0022A85AF0|nr:SpoIIE family protein phosphatase [Nonomuraea aridisoli]
MQAATERDRFPLYVQAQVLLAEGTVIVLYTDGLIETRESDLEAGMDRLRSTLSQESSLQLEQFCTNVVATMVGDTSEDDVALLMARTVNAVS